MKIEIILLIAVFFLSCNSESNKVKILNGRIDSLEAICSKTPIIENIIDSLHAKNNNQLSKLIPNVIRHNAIPIKIPVNLYEPFGLNIEIIHARPQFDSDVFLCVPAAFTTRNTKIDGLFIEKGKIINDSINSELNGACIINLGGIEIIRSEIIDSALIEKIKNKGESIFQQVLLIHDSKIVECKLWKNVANLRRALVKLGGDFYVVESHGPV